MSYTYFLLFVLYSFLGWCMEVAITTCKDKKIVNRGFLMGPYCPIYGCGCLLLITLLDDYVNEPFALFAMAIIICSLLEYFTSWLMEVIFKMRWWDYSQNKFNINGRICLETMVPFGIIGVLVVRYINPVFVNLINKLPSIVINLSTVILACVIVIDYIVSSNVLFNMKGFSKEIRKDSTEDIKKQMKKKITHNKILYNRLMNAFPNLYKIVDYQKKKNKEIKKKIKEKNKKKK